VKALRPRSNSGRWPPDSMFLQGVGFLGASNRELGPLERQHPRSPLSGHQKDWPSPALSCSTFRRRKNSSLMTPFGTGEHLIQRPFIRSVDRVPCSLRVELPRFSRDARVTLTWRSGDARVMPRRPCPSRHTRVTPQDATIGPREPAGRQICIFGSCDAPRDAPRCRIRGA
jgi:hypothetical protein